MTDDASVLTFRKAEKPNHSAAIFVHGFTGDNRKTWGDFPVFLMGDTKLNHWDIFSVKYKSTLLLPELRGLWKAAPDIQKLADTFATRVKTEFDRYEHLAFIAHSMGGLIVQRALLDCPETRRRTSHLFLFGTPSNGLVKAAIGMKFTGRRQVRDMAKDGPFIVRLHRDWETVFGCGNFGFHFRAVAGESDEFVPSDSANPGFPRACCYSIPGGHLDIVKPKSADNLAVRIVAKGLRERRIQKKTGDDPESEAEAIDPHQQLPREPLKALLNHFSQNPPNPDELATAYRTAISDENRRQHGLPNPETVKWPDIVRELLDLPASEEGSWPIVRFLKALRDGVKNRNDQESLSEIIEKIEAHLGHQDIRDRPEIETRPPHLLIDLEPHSNSARQFTATVYDWRGPEQSDKQKPEIITTGTEKQITADLACLLNDFDPDNLPESVEVFLPPDWVTAVRPEQWPRNDDPELPELFGEHYPTVVRLNRRMDGVQPEWVKRWKEKWNCMETLSEEATQDINSCACRICESECGNLKSLLRRLNRTDTPPLLVAPFPPVKLAETAKGLGQVLLRAGCPAAVWGNTKQAEIENLINGGSILDLPGLLHKQRRDEETEMTLLWDDPNRLPPQEPFADHELLGPTENL